MRPLIWSYKMSVFTADKAGLPHESEIMLK